MKRYIKKALGRGFLVESMRSIRHRWRLNYGVISEFHGIRLRKNNTSDASFEEQEIMHFSSALSYADLVIDIGANVGIYTILSAKNGINVDCFEPGKDNLDFLMNNIMLNAVSDQVKVFPLGCSDRCDLRVFYGDSTAGSFVEDWAGTDRNYNTIVPTVDLDQFYHRYKNKNLLIKIDVEGSEHEVLIGSKKILSDNTNITLFIEITFSEHRLQLNRYFFETFSYLFELGFSCESISNRQMITQNELEEFRSDLIVRDWMFSGNYIFKKLKR
ncbi:FkbM family methyltransferase [Amylibacter sp.]|nr:FkbM family methyltransferase [Amylibacter sp.]